MKFKALNLLAYSSTAVAFFAFGANMAQAQVETMNATLATSSAIDTVVVDGWMDSITLYHCTAIFCHPTKKTIHTIILGGMVF